MTQEERGKMLRLRPGEHTRDPVGSGKVSDRGKMPRLRPRHQFGAAN